MTFWIINGFLILGFSFFLYNVFREYISKAVYVAALLIKLASGILLGLLYTYHYEGGDTLNFFSDSIYYSSAFEKEFSDGFKLFFNWQGEQGMIYYMQPRALLLVRFATLLNLISGQNYWITNLYFSLFNFCCSLYFAKTLMNANLLPKRVIIISLFFVPSVVFWTSGILKEALIYGCLMVLSALFVKLSRRKAITIGEYFLGFFALLFTYLIKYYVAAVLLPVCITFFIVERINKDRFKWLQYFSTFFLLVTIVSWIHPNLNWDNFLQVIVSNHDLLVEIAPDSLIIKYHDLQATFYSFVLNLPNALISALIRPSIFEITNFLVLLAAIENAILTILIIVAGVSYFKNRTTQKQSGLLISTFIYIIFISVFLAFSTPVFGTLVRFKVFYLPFFVLIILSQILSKNPREVNAHHIAT